MSSKGKGRSRRKLLACKVDYQSGLCLTYSLWLEVTCDVVIQTDNAGSGEAVPGSGEGDAGQRGRLVAEGVADAVCENAAQLSWGFNEAQATKVEAEEALARVLKEVDDAISTP